MRASGVKASGVRAARRLDAVIHPGGVLVARRTLNTRKNALRISPISRKVGRKRDTTSHYASGGETHII